MNIPNSFATLIRKYLLGFETREEYHTLKDSFDEQSSLQFPTEDIIQGGQKRVRERLFGHPAFIEVIPFHKKYRLQLQVAASIFIIVSASLSYIYYRNNLVFNPVPLTQLAAIQPAKEKVKLSFEDGKVIILDKTGKSVPAIDGIQEIKNGELVYNNQADKIVQNTLSTPRGQLFKIALPDGTKVWMNANSSLTYPSKFTGTERLVELHGEAYFEVTKNPAQPFIVKTSNQDIKVLGTHFNVQAYDNEPLTKTTLVEGKVEVQQRNQKLVLSPNQQALSNASSISKKSVDATEYAAWREGYFTFNNASPNEIMRQLARWYDLRVELDNSNFSEKFSGKILKQTNLKEVLEVLRTAGISIRIEKNNNNVRMIRLAN
ncbi:MULTISPECIES: FecR family protein [Sphingobacterium]|uniref:FecR family protein n=1 Tax=Sphingobacterium TaxID=28453 RepID=UPI00257CC849|nr:MULTISPECIES: FecR family protein [Sphingobacterium]